MTDKLKTFLESSIQGNIIDAVDLVKKELDTRLEEERKLIESEVYSDLGFKLNESDDEDEEDDMDDKKDKKKEEDGDDEESEDDDEE